MLLIFCLGLTDSSFSVLTPCVDAIAASTCPCARLLNIRCEGGSVVMLSVGRL